MEEKALLPDLSTVSLMHIPQRSQVVEEEESPGELETLAASARTATVIGQLGTSVTANIIRTIEEIQEGDDPDFDGWEFVKKHYPQYADEFVGSVTKSDFLAVADGIDSRLADYQTLGKAGAKGTVYSLLAAAGDPVNYVSLGAGALSKVKTGVDIVKYASKVGASLAAVNGGAEALIANLDPTRDMNDVQEATLWGLFLGFGLGGAIGGVQLRNFGKLVQHAKLSRLQVNAERRVTRSQARAESKVAGYEAKLAELEKSVEGLSRDTEFLNKAGFETRNLKKVRRKIREQLGIYEKRAKLREAKALIEEGRYQDGVLKIGRKPSGIVNGVTLDHRVTVPNSIVHDGDRKVVEVLDSLPGNSRPYRDLEVVKAAGMERLRMSPVMRGVTSPLKTARDLFDRLFEHPFAFKDAEQGLDNRHAAWTEVKGDSRALKVKVIMEADAAWQKVKPLAKSMKIKRRDFEALIAKMGRRRNQLDPELLTPIERAALEASKRIFDGHYTPHAREAVQVGLLKESDLLENYVPMVIDKHTARKYWGEFRGLVRDLLTRYREGEVPSESEVDKLSNAFIGMNSYRPADWDKGVRKAVKGHLKERNIYIPDDMLDQFERFLVNDIHELTARYAHSVIPDTKFFRELGTFDIEEIMKPVAEERDRLAAANPELKPYLDKEFSTLKDDVEVLLTVLRGDGPRPGAVVRAIRGWIAAAKLGSMSVSSFSDLAKIMFNNSGVASKAIFKATTRILDPKFRRFYRKHTGQLKALGIAVESELGSRTGYATGDFLDSAGFKSQWHRATDWAVRDIAKSVGSFVGVGLEKMGRTMGLVTVMDIMNSGLKRITAFTHTTDMVEAMEAVVKGTASKRQRLMLADSGFKPEDAKEILDKLRKDGALDYSDGIYAVDFDKVTDPDLARNFQLSLLRNVDTIINTPNPALLPKWAIKHPVAGLVFSLKSFIWAAHQQTLVRMLQRPDGHKAFGALMSVVLGGVSVATRILLSADSEEKFKKYYGGEKGHLNFFLDALDYSGLLTVPFEVDNTLGKLTGMNARRAITGRMGRRYANVDAAGALGGPAVGLINSGLSVARDVVSGNITDRTIHNGRIIFPYQNVAYLRMGVDELEKALKKAIR